MPLVVGIDEAGYGPTLGPLVIGASLWRVVPTHVDADYWTLLDDAVCRSKGRNESRLPVGDSKKIYDRKKGIATLERSVLAFAHAAGHPGETLGELLAAFGFRPPANTLPWYRDLSRTLPIDPQRSAYTGAAAKLSASMEHAGVTCMRLAANVITEDAYNQRVTQTGNKAAVLLEAVLRHAYRAGQAAGDQDLHVLVDRLGGRSDYRSVLMDAFPDRHLHVVELSDTCSRYRLAAQRNDWFVSFVVDGDQRHMPIALASMVAKYARETIMMGFNAYWHERDVALKPTAGYYTDAQRFLKDVAPWVDRDGPPVEHFVRAR